ncbi:MAG: protein-L-isoaspartate(D-aspartate) O-methyltransferase [bacterium]
MKIPPKFFEFFHGKDRSSAQNGAESDEEKHFARLRDRMVDEQLRTRGVKDPLVLNAMCKIPRHLFVPERLRDQAYEDGPLTIGCGQTISQPYMVAVMSELLRLQPGDRVLEVGTGSGYQAAVLAEMGLQVYTIEIVAELLERAKTLLASMQYRRVEFRLGDAFQGWPEAAPFHGIMLTAAPLSLPQPLKDQLAEGGRIVAPLGEEEQYLWVFTKVNGQLLADQEFGVRFVPMTGKALLAPRED